MRRIGIIGGTFDPPHNGHLLIASEVLHALGLEEIWFMPNNIPPHKKINMQVSTQNRMDMILHAIEGNPRFRLETIEIERDGKSYTYDTIELLRKMHVDTEFYFIIGGDMVEYLPKWHRIHELVNFVTFVGVKRPGYSFTCPFPIQEVEIPQFDVSSSMLRDRFAEKGNTMYLLPQKVRQYIEENHLYGT